MGQQIIKQGHSEPQLYCIWSSVVDDIIVYDATREEVHDYLLSRIIEDFERSFSHWMKDVNDEIIYKPFGLTWKDVKDYVERARDETMA